MTNKSVTCCYTVISSIDSGGENIIDNSYASFIGGGDHNHISPLGGQQPYVVERDFIGGGIGNKIHTQCASIVGGQENVIRIAGVHSFIGGGGCNVITGPCSAILGGAGNSDGGLANVQIAGSGIAAVNANSLHVNGIWANGIPVYAGGPAPAVGTVFVVTPGGPVPAGASGALWIM
jgi:hypothetical protein